MVITIQWQQRKLLHKRLIIAIQIEIVIVYCVVFILQKRPWKPDYHQFSELWSYYSELFWSAIQDIYFDGMWFSQDISHLVWLIFGSFLQKMFLEWIILSTGSCYLTPLGNFCVRAFESQHLSEKLCEINGQKLFEKGQFQRKSFKEH